MSQNKLAKLRMRKGATATTTEKKSTSYIIIYGIYCSYLIMVPLAKNNNNKSENSNLLTKAIPDKTYYGLSHEIRTKIWGTNHNQCIDKKLV